MNTLNKQKREYRAPMMEKVQLDNDISLALESTPPDGPGEVTSLAPEYFNNDPLKCNLG